MARFLRYARREDGDWSFNRTRAVNALCRPWSYTFRTLAGPINSSSAHTTPTPANPATRHKYSVLCMSLSVSVCSPRHRREVGDGEARQFGLEVFHDDRIQLNVGDHHVSVAAPSVKDQDHRRRGLRFALGRDMNEVAPLPAIDSDLARVITGTKRVGGDDSEEQKCLECANRSSSWINVFVLQRNDSASSRRERSCTETHHEFRPRMDTESLGDFCHVVQLPNQSLK